MAKTRAAKTLMDARDRLRRTYDRSYLQKGVLRPTIHGAILALSYALGEKELEDIIADKTDRFMAQVNPRKPKAAKKTGKNR